MEEKNRENIFDKIQGIEKEIWQYKKRGVDGFEIIQKLMRKGYRLADIKKVIKERGEIN